MIDETDRRLVALLRANAREPAASLAKKLKVSRGTVQNRIARMLAGGAIRGFTVRMAAAAEADQMRAIMCIAIAAKNPPRWCGR